MTLRCTENLHTGAARTRAVNIAGCPASHLAINAVNIKLTNIFSLIGRMHGIIFSKISFIILVIFQGDCNKKLDDYEREVSECRLHISQHEAKMASLQDTLKSLEEEKRALETQV